MCSSPSCYNKVIELLEFIIQHPRCSEGLDQRLAHDFEQTRAAYRLKLKDGCFYPVSSAEQAKALEKSLAVVSGKKFGGAQVHLQKAAKFLGSGKFGDSVRESIHAVESVACIVTDQPGATLSDAIKKLEKAGIEMHGAFKGGLDKCTGIPATSGA